MTPQKPGFSGGNLDRADHLRSDAAAIARLRQDARARVLMLEGFGPVLAADGGLAWRTVGEADEGAFLVFLGLQEECAQFVSLQVQSTDAPLFRSPRTMQVLAALGPQDMAIYGAARSLL